MRKVVRLDMAYTAYPQPGCGGPVESGEKPLTFGNLQNITLRRLNTN